MLFVDNMTMQGARDLLEPGWSSGRQRRQEHHDDVIMYKWDTAGSGSIRTVVNIACLSILVESIVIGETIFIGSDLTETWRDSSQRVKLGERLDFGDAADILSVPDADTLELTASAIHRAAAAARSDQLDPCISMLREDAVFETFLQLTDGYFGTGYSDPGAFSNIPLESRFGADKWTIPILTGDSDFSEIPDLAVENPVGDVERPRRIPPLRKGASDRESQEYLATLYKYLKQQEAYLDKQRAKIRVLEEMTRRAKMWNDSLEEYLELRGAFQSEPSQPLVTQLTDADGLSPFHAQRGAEAIFQNLIAVAYYEELAATHDCFYRPHPLRSPLLELVKALSSRSDGFYPELDVARLLPSLRKQRFEYSTEDRQNDVFTGYIDVEVPHFLALILSESAGPGDIIEKAISIRESPKARRLRRYMQELRNSIQGGDLTAADVSKYRAEIQRVCTAWTDRHSTTAGVNAKVTVSLGIVGVEVETPITGRFRGRRPFSPMSLLQDMRWVDETTVNLSPSLERVFGQDVAQSWNHAKKIFTQTHIGKYSFYR